jgi:hypothetical protein
MQYMPSSGGKKALQIPPNSSILISSPFIEKTTILTMVKSDAGGL